MYPLIEIKSVPIEIKMNVKHAQLEYKRGTAEMEVSRDSNGGLSIKSRPIKLNLDSFEARNSITPTTVRSIEQAAQSGKQASYQATATYAQQGKLLLNAQVGEGDQALTQIEKENFERDIHINTGLEFLPSTGVDVQWEEGDLQIQYEMDKLNFDWKIDQAQFEFTPGDIEISVEQRPEVIIKYIGGPIYVPPSADPQYVDVTV